jgi:hypothetical protein
VMRCVRASRSARSWPVPCGVCMRRDPSAVGRFDAVCACVAIRPRSAGLMRCVRASRSTCGWPVQCGVCVRRDPSAVGRCHAVCACVAIHPRLAGAMRCVRASRSTRGWPVRCGVCVRRDPPAVGRCHAVCACVATRPRLAGAMRCVRASRSTCGWPVQCGVCVRCVPSAVGRCDAVCACVTIRQRFARTSRPVRTAPLIGVIPRRCVWSVSRPLCNGPACLLCLPNCPFRRHRQHCKRPAPPPPSSCFVRLCFQLQPVRWEVCLQWLSPPCLLLTQWWSWARGRDLRQSPSLLRGPGAMAHRSPPRRPTLQSLSCPPLARPSSSRMAMRLGWPMCSTT